MKSIYILTAFIFLLLSQSCTDNFGGDICGYVRTYEDYTTEIPDASAGIEVTLTETQETYVTDETGFFIFEKLEPGSYTLEISKSGFQSRTILVPFIGGQEVTWVSEDFIRLYPADS